MAITNVAEYAHLSKTDLEALGDALGAIRRDIENSRGASDRAYIQRAIMFQRCLDVTARLIIAASRTKTGCALGTAALATAKSIENMELGHNICHGQWDRMNDPEIHSSTWEWDMASVSAQWRYAHNYRHHMFTNVIGMDDDLGYGIMRVTPDQPWRLSNLLQPLRNILLAIMFEWGIALQGWESQQRSAATRAEKSALTRSGQDHPPSRQGLSDLSRAESSTMAPHPHRECVRQPAAQRLGLRGDLLWSFRRRHTEIHARRPTGRDQTRMVPATNAGHRELPRRTRISIPQRKPLLPDRAPPIPRPFE